MDRKARNGTKKFSARVTIDVDIEVSKSVLKTAQSKSWRETFYNFKTDDEVAAHLAYNLVRGAALSQLDGFANRDDSEAAVISIETDVEVQP